MSRYSSRVQRPPFRLTRHTDPQSCCAAVNVLNHGNVNPTPDIASLRLTMAGSSTLRPSATQVFVKTIFSSFLPSSRLTSSSRHDASYAQRGQGSWQGGEQRQPRRFAWPLRRARRSQGRRPSPILASSPLSACWRDRPHVISLIPIPISGSEIASPSKEAAR